MPDLKNNPGVVYGVVKSYKPKKAVHYGKVPGYKASGKAIQYGKVSTPDNGFDKSKGKFD